MTPEQRDACILTVVAKEEDRPLGVLLRINALANQLGVDTEAYNWATTYAYTPIADLDQSWGMVDDYITAINKEMDSKQLSLRLGWTPDGARVVLATHDYFKV